MSLKEPTSFSFYICSFLSSQICKNFIVLIQFVDPLGVMLPSNIPSESYQVFNKSNLRLSGLKSFFNFSLMQLICELMILTLSQVRGQISFYKCVHYHRSHSSKRIYLLSKVYEGSRVRGTVPWTTTQKNWLFFQLCDYIWSFHLIFFLCVQILALLYFKKLKKTFIYF